MDRISQLPEHIIHHVLSFLPALYVARCTILSKTWRLVCASLPIFDLDQTFFGPSGCVERMINNEKEKEERMKRLKNIEKFKNFVDDSLLRVCMQRKLHVQKFRFCMTFYNIEFASRIDHCIDLASEWNVEELELALIDPWNVEELELALSDPKPRYHVPRTILASKSLTILKLCACRLDQFIITDTIKFRSLRMLSLSAVYLDEQIIQNFISSCPLIEEFIMKMCLGLKHLQICGLHKLKKVEVFPRPKVLKSVDIEAPSLQTFRFGYYWDIKCKITMVTCHNLKMLFLVGAIFTDQSFQDHLCKFSALETLHLRDCDMSKFIVLRISSRQLKRLIFEECKKLVGVMIDTPNLCFFKYMGLTMPFLSLMNTSVQLEIELKLLCYDHLDTLWFLSLRKFLGNFRQIKLLTLHFMAEENSFNLDELREIYSVPPPLSDVKYLELCNIKPSSSYAALLDGILWSSHPETLFLSPYRDFIKFLSEKLMSREEDPCGCNASRIKCWRHYLKDVKIERWGYGETQDERRLHTNIFSDREDPQTYFRLKW